MISAFGLPLVVIFGVNMAKIILHVESAFCKIEVKPLSRQYCLNTELTAPLGKINAEIGSQVACEAGKFSHQTRNFHLC